MTFEPASSSFPRFASTVHHYVAGRPNYAQALIQTVADHLHLTKRHRLMDLGCGPGWLGIAFAPLVGQVVGVDPEPAMLEAASALAATAGVDIEWIEGSSYDLGPQLGRFRAVAIGRAFHWMDRAATLRTLDALIEDDGAVLLFNDVRPDVPQNTWYKRYSEVVDRFTNRSVGFAPERLRHEALLLESAFSQLSRIGVIEQRRVPVERLIDRALSMSTSSPEQLGALTDQLVQDMTTEMAPFASDGHVVEVIESQALIARRR
ncbi:class I SAM-dependent methyltransferase [Bradyrhizobium sp. HKCCYLRH3099]|uniref:class I SAM-dependent methyltransferase n=1 Tax=unclassified Bradyrhizobium TaxID=2631580 RepID=UPI003EBE7C3F